MRVILSTSDMKEAIRSYLKEKDIWLTDDALIIVRVVGSKANLLENMEVEIVLGAAPTPPPF